MKTDLAQSERPVQSPNPRQVGRARLLIITIDAPFLVTHRLPLACAARDAGYDVHIAAPVDSSAIRGDVEAKRTIEGEGLAFHEIPLKRSSTNIGRELRLLGALDGLIRALRPDLMHCVGMKPVLYAGAIARVRNRTVVHAVTGLGHAFMGQGLKTRLRRFALMRAYAFAFGHRGACVIVQNPDDRDLFAKARVLSGQRTFLLRGTGADLNRFRPRAGTDRRPAGPLVIMLAARLIAAKGIGEFVDVARRIKARGIGARFVLLGQRDPENPTCIGEDDLTTWQDAQAIEWWGHSITMSETLRQADIFCLPTYYREGTPKVLIEAAATGLPLVSTDMPGCREVVRHGQNGLLVPPRDVDALEAALMRLITDGDFREAAGARSREIAAAEFSLDAFLTASLAVYQAALGTHLEHRQA